LEINVLYRDYTSKIILGFTFISLLLGLTIEVVYRELFESLTKLALTEEYSYILASLFSILIVIYLSLRYTGFSYGVRTSKILASILLATLALSIYELSLIDLEHKIQLQSLSFSLFFIGLILLVYEPNTIGESIPLLTPFLLTPLPARFLDSLTPVLSRYIGRLVGFITGVRVVETPGFTQLEVATPTGSTIYLSVEVACTGIVTVSSIIASLPIIIYMLTFSIDKPRRKIAIATASLLTALIIGIIGNIVRALIMVYSTMWIGVEQAYNLFHYSPSLLYSAISVIAAFKIITKYAKFKPVFSRVLSKGEVPRITWSYIIGVLLVSLVFTSIFTATTIYASQSTVIYQSIPIQVGSIYEFIENPEKYLSREGIEFTTRYYDAFLTRVLGALAVYRVSLRYFNEYYTGYIEVVDTPARIHTWQLCLTLQGYNITASWYEQVNNTKIGFIALEKQGWRGLLAYTLFPVKISVGRDEYTIYVRVSIMNTGDPRNIAPKTASILNSIAGVSIESDNNLLHIFFQSVYIILVLFVVYMGVLLAWSKLRLKHGGVS